MSSWARVGVKCVCIKGGSPLCDGASILGRYPITGGVYTVDGVSRDEMFDKTLLHLAEFPTMEMRRGGLRGWDASRFRPLHTIESDAEMFRALIDGMGPLERLDRLGELLDTIPSP